MEYSIIITPQPGRNIPSLYPRGLDGIFPKYNLEAWMEYSIIISSRPGWNIPSI